MRHGQAPTAHAGLERAAEFEAFMKEGEPKLRRALAAAYGLEDGRDATAEALAYAWEHWERVREMPNAMGYLFRVAQSSCRRRRVPVLYDVSGWPDHPFEPGLPGALATLSRRQRMVVVLVHGFGYTLHEVAELTGLRRTTVQNHSERGLARLRDKLGVVLETDLENQIRELIDGGTRPVSFQEIRQRRAPAARREAGRRRTLITVAASGVAAAGCAAGLAVALDSPGAPARPVARAIPSASPSSQRSVFLTAATIRQVASASQSALANSGVERISYRSVKDGTVTSAGADTVTYSGSDWSYAVTTTVPAYPDSLTRVVHGQFYLELSPRTPWLHEIGEGTSPHFPKAATLLRLLSPAANFQNAGTDVIGGLRLTHLHATRVSGLPGDPTLSRYANLVSAVRSAVVPPGTLTALDMWVDSRGVVHQMKIQLEGGDGATTLTVTFMDSGQPQSISAPATSGAVPGNP